MKLVDFKQNESFDLLRSKMGMEDYGKFELFDPIRHLSWQERQSLSSDWSTISSSGLHSYGDKTLAYKNSHIFCLNGDKIHFALCDQIKKSIQQGKMANANVTLKVDLLTEQPVCEYCLHAVSHQGFDVYRHRHQEYNANILRQFNLLNYISNKYS
jgi:hypothetical protein